MMKNFFRYNVALALLTAWTFAQPMVFVCAKEKNATSMPYCIHAKYVLTEHSVLIDRYVVIRDERISSIQTERPLDMPVLVADHHILSPAFINTHDHIEYNHVGPLEKLACSNHYERYNHRHDWRLGCRGFQELNAPANRDRGVVAWNELRQLISGTTSVVSSGGVSGFLRNFGNEKTPDSPFDPKREGLHSRRVYAETFPLGDTAGQQLPSGTGYPQYPNIDEIQDCVYIPHVAEGVDACARNEFLNLSGDDGKVNILGTMTGCVHMTSLLDEDIKKFAESQSTLIWSPRSNLSLYGNTAFIKAYREYGVNICLGSDWTYSGSMNLLDELNVAVQFNCRFMNHLLSGYDFWKMVTVNPARLLQISDQLGDIRPGMFADLVLFDIAGKNCSQSSAYSLAITSPIENVDLVTRGGKILYGAESLLEPFSNNQEGWEPLVVNSKRKWINLTGEMAGGEFEGDLNNANFEKLQSHNKDNFPLFPPIKNLNRPCSVPVRGYDRLCPQATRYPIYSVSMDYDQDGIPNYLDNDPMYFNPLRPVDVTDNNGQQSKSKNMVPLFRPSKNIPNNNNIRRFLKLLNRYLLDSTLP